MSNGKYSVCSACTYCSENDGGWLHSTVAYSAGDVMMFSAGIA